MPGRVLNNPGGGLSSADIDAEWLRRDGGNTITGDILPDSDIARSLGAFNTRFERIDSRRLVVGGQQAGTASTVDFLYGFGGIVGVGYLRGPSALGRIRHGGYSYPPVATFGNIWTNDVTGVAEILNAGGGSFATGSSFTVGANGVARIRMDDYAYGSFVGGYAFCAGNAGKAYLQNYAAGAFVWGYAGANTGTNRIEATSAAAGSTTLGRLGGTGSHNLGSQSAGCFTAGYCGGSSAHKLNASGVGAFAQGRAGGNGGNGTIQATNQGSFAQGRTQSYGTILSSGRGSFAQGNAQNTGAYIYAAANGAFSQGHAVNGYGINASGIGSFAHGAAITGTITASGQGAFAVGDATAGNITASASNAFQLGVGANATANSLQMGQGVLLADGGVSRIGDAGGVTDYLQIDQTGDLLFVGGAGVDFGGMTNDSATTVTISAANVWAEITSGFVTGQVHNVTFAGAHYLQVAAAGRYLANMSITLRSANNEIVGAALAVNGVEQTAGHGHATIPGTNDNTSMSQTLVLDLAANDQVSVSCVNHGSSTNLDVLHCSVTVVQIGGT